MLSILSHEKGIIILNIPINPLAVTVDRYLSRNKFIRRTVTIIIGKGIMLQNYS